ncbi:putative HTH-type transcriptional regulator YybR [Mariprofundus micogutta]|uniref:Putative HTH-type transcriptional regulator YybR n=1 Tax=Mariprofundus micogutta TaxID=1921010 RepID=A0A1L8CRE1_9PROT|nr:helix-turn-helix domain-containing protein [Mariprofundus micogutta]GAV21467.1 putative HTH-type transcriptional regulator YybR [Mariprofundus micogutta]
MSINFQREAPCPIAQLLELLGDRWSLLIIRDAFYGVRRFDGFQQHLGISKKVLTMRLTTLVDAEIMKKERYQSKPERYEYRLTAKGRELFPVLLTMMRWGNRWLVDEGEETVQLLHSNCGEKTEPRMVCSHCEQPITPARIQAVPGPGANREVVQAFRQIVRKSEVKKES